MDKENKSHKCKELSEFERGEVIGLLEESCSERKISKLLDIPKSTVYDTIKKFSETGTTENFFRPGRPQILNELNISSLKKLFKMSLVQLQVKYKKNFKKKLTFLY